MTPHALSAEEGTPHPSGWVVRSWCLCSHLFIGRGATVKRAKRVIRRKARDHAGQAAAGPVGET